MSNKKLVSFRMPEELIESLRERAGDDGISVTELVCRLLKKGLANSNDEVTEQVEALVDKRVATLETELRELKDKKSQVDSLVSSPLFSLLAQNSVSRDHDIEIQNRLGRLERMMERVIETQLSGNSSK